MKEMHKLGQETHRMVHLHKKAKVLHQMHLGLHKLLHQQMELHRIPRGQQALVHKMEKIHCKLVLGIQN